MREPEEPEIDPKKFAEYRDQIDERDVTPDDFGRIAAQTAKQVILQRIREAERDMMYEEYRDRVGELITGIVQQSDSRYTLVQLRERVEALLPKSEQVEGERYDHSQRIKAVIKEVSPSTKGPAIIVSRRDPELIKKLFELEVPEIADGLVEIANVAREPGYRSKIAVISHTDGVDPVGACVGPRGSRVRMVVSELRGEKIDIIPFNDEPARFVAKALSPARVREVLVDDEAKQATVIVPDDQLSLAIGREGQNARLAARLTGWRVDIRSETEFAAEEAEHGYEEEEVQGRCAAILSNGRRCPNASLPGSRYCGLESHQALAEHRQRQRRRPRRRGAARAAEAEAAAERPPPRRRRRASRAPAGAPPTAPSAQREPRRGTQRARGGRRGARRHQAAPHVPRRRCVGCGRIAPKSELLRIAAGRSAIGRRRREPRATAVLDRDGTMPGRGAYLCRGGDRRAPAAAMPACARCAAAGSPARCARGDARPQARRIGELDEQEARTRDRQGARALEQGAARRSCKAAGIEAKAAASSVEEAAALKALGAGDAARATASSNARPAAARRRAARRPAPQAQRPRHAPRARPARAAERPQPAAAAPAPRARRRSAASRAGRAALGAGAAAPPPAAPAPRAAAPRPPSACVRRATRAPASARPATSARADAGAS